MRKTQRQDTFHDFNDGNGFVAAHRHANGGGWVADSAHVEATAFVGPFARVFGYAIVSGSAVVDEQSEVSGYATVKDRACVKGKAVIRGMCILKDDAQVGGEVFLSGNIVLDGQTVFDHGENIFDYKDCLTCPALLDENYSASHFNPCLYCLEKQGGAQAKDGKSSRQSIWSWTPKHRRVDQGKQEEA